jgi:hypothetical protein
MSVDWVKEQYNDEQTAQVDGGKAGVYPSKKLDKLRKPQSWHWYFAPSIVAGECVTEEGAKAAALSALTGDRRVQWANFGAKWYEAGEQDQIAVVAGLVLRVQWVSGGRTAKPGVSNDQHGGWDWSVLRDNVRVADGWCKTIDEAKTAAETAASAAEAGK